MYKKNLYACATKRLSQLLIDIRQLLEYYLATVNLLCRDIRSVALFLGQQLKIRTGDLTVVPSPKLNSSRGSSAVLLSNY